MTGEQIMMLKRFQNGGTFSDWDSQAGEVMRYLLKTGRISADCRKGQDYFRATQAGLAELSELHERADQKAKDERQRRFQNQVSVTQALVPFVTFILGIVVEHCSGLTGPLWRWIENLIK